MVAITSAERADEARRAGADEVIDLTAASTGVEPVDLVFDTDGRRALARSPASCARRHVGVDRRGAARRRRGDYFVVEPTVRSSSELRELVDEGALRPTIDSVFPLADARAAFERGMERRQAWQGGARVAARRQSMAAEGPRRSGRCTPASRS